MAFDRFLIAPFDTGLETYLRPWLIPEDSWALLQNAYVFRGRVRKRFGEELMGAGTFGSVTAPLFSRLRVQVGTTDGAGNIAGIVPGKVFAVGQAFSIGNEIFTVAVNAAPGVMLDTGASTVHTYNTTTGAFVIQGAAALTAVYFYPALPVMGLTIYEDAPDPFNDDPAYAFDTQFAYIFTGSAWARSQSGGQPVFTGTNINFFWTTNWRGITADIKTLYVTNFNFTLGLLGGASVNDPIWWTSDGSTWVSNSAAGNSPHAFYFFPSYGGAPQVQYTGPYILTARIILPFHNRLLLLNTIENDNANHNGTLPGSTNTQYKNRCRFSHLGSPIDVNNAWYEPNQRDTSGGFNSIADGAGFLDASTDEEIISAEFIKDRLIVYFEQSTWELVYLGNQIEPFSWQKINTELGSEATFSTVPFDKVVLTMSQRGVHACNGANVERIDTKIPDTTFQITQKNLGIQRVFGIRDYFTEMVYWTYPSIQHQTSSAYPSQVLVYNYRTGSWAQNDDTITAFGYFDQSTSVTWATALTNWEEADFLWDSGEEQSNYQQVIAGNQQGYTFIIDPDTSRNAPVLQITNIAPTGGNTRQLLTIIAHNLEANSYIAIENAQGITFDYPPNQGIFQASVVDANTVSIVAHSIGVYTGGGTATRVSNIQLKSKQWNPYVSKDRNVYLQRIDFGVTTTPFGSITVDYSPSSTSISILDDGAANGSLVGTGVLETFPYPRVPLELTSQRVWHPVYFQSDGECIQLSMYLNDDLNLAKSQIRQQTIAWSDFQLEGMVLYTMPTTSRMQ